MTSRQQQTHTQQQNKTPNHNVAIDIYAQAQARELIKLALKTDEMAGANSGPASGAMKTLTAPKPSAPPEPPKTPTIHAPTAPKPPKPPVGPTTWQNMTANAGRTGTGFLGTAAGGVGTVATGIPAAATNAWNAATPKSWNAPKGWTQGVNDVFNKTVNFTGQSAKDIYGGLGGDMNYHTSLSNNAMEAGLNAPGVDPTTKALAQTGRDVGQHAWNTALAAGSGNIAVGALKRAPGATAAAQAYSSHVPGWIQKGTAYATGLPTAQGVNNIGAMGSLLGQNFVGSVARGVDRANATNGTQSNYADIEKFLPATAVQRGIENALGPDAGNVVNTALYSRLLGPNLSSAIPLLAPTAVVSGMNNLSQAAADTQAQPAPAQEPAQEPAQGPAPVVPNVADANQTEQPSLPYADAATYANPADRAKLYAPDSKQHEAVQQSVSAAALPNATPEQKQQAQQDFQSFMQQQADSQPEFKAGAADLVSGKNTPQAQAFRKHLESVGNDVMDAELKRLYAENPNPTPEQAGSFMSQATDAWNNLGTPGQIMVGLGGGLALVSMIMSLFGGGGDDGGGLGSMLLPMLGLGVAGVGAAGAGMFGSGAQNAVVDTLGSMGQSMGFMPKSLSPEQKSILTAKDPIQAALAGAGSNLTREQAAKRVEEAKTQLGNLKLMRSLGGLMGTGQNRLFENMGLTPEEAALAVKNVGVLSDAYSDPNSQLNQQLQQAEWYADPNKSGWQGRALEALGPQNVQNVMNFFTGK